MALLVGSNTLETVFTPAATPFIAQATGNGMVRLERRNAAAAPWAVVANMQGQAVVVDNPVAGADFRFVSDQGQANVAVRADQ